MVGAGKLADCLAYAVRATITERVPLAGRAGQATALMREEPEPDPFGPPVDLRTVQFQAVLGGTPRPS